ncbi:MAG: YceI family protein [Flavobacteriales bacterium]|nr:YceI family protein [Flavobacteriales bacterium]
MNRITLMMAFTIGLLVNGQTQTLLKLDTSYIRFFSEAPLENIEAVNRKSSGLINMSTNDIALIIPIISFKFDKELMEEHFNENYMESSKYKSGSFKGKLKEKIEWGKDGDYNATAEGVLNIHGVEKKRTIEGKITIKNGTAHLSTRFMIKVADHDIEIPQVVFMNIAEEVEVTGRLYFVPKK